MKVHPEPGRPPATLRPARALFRQSLLAVGLGSTLIFTVLYWLTVPLGVWPVVVEVHVGLVVIALVISRQFIETHIVLTTGGLEERNLNGGNHEVPRGDVQSVLIIDLYRDHSADTLSHLFVVDAEGHLLLRMRGQYWTRENMDQVATHLGVRVERSSEPVSKAEFAAASPELLYWFERPTQLGRILSPWASSGRPLTRPRRRS